MHTSAAKKPSYDMTGPIACEAIPKELGLDPYEGRGWRGFHQFESRPTAYNGLDQKRESSREDDSRFAQWATPRATTKALGRGAEDRQENRHFLDEPAGVCYGFSEPNHED
jgi:hypothetical protein